MTQIVSMSSGAIDPIAVSKRVFWRPETASTVAKVGTPVCYNHGVNTDHKERTVDPTHLGLTIDTYAEGEQEFTGRMFNVELPNNDNINEFAGVIKCLGPKAGADGDMIEIWIPNGAMVPALVGISVTKCRTLVGIKSGATALETAIYNTRSANCALCQETVDGSTTESLCWVNLYSPLMFNKSSQDQDYEDLIVGVGHTTGDINVFKEYVGIWATGGTFKTRMWRTDIRADGVSCPYGGMLAMQLRLFAESDAQGGGITNTYITTEFANGSTIAAGVPVKNLYLRLYDEGATLTAADQYFCNLYMENHIDSSSGENYQIASYVHGSDALDAFIYAPDNKSLAAAACGADEAAHVIGFDGDSPTLKIAINVGGTTYYLLAGEAIQGVADA